MRTGLLSLNIHDSLTFDGSELCLHPDLFSIPTDIGVGNMSSQSQQASAPPPSHHPSQQSQSQTHVRRRSNEELLGAASTHTAGNSNVSTTSGTTGSNQSTVPPTSSAGLAVGDIIEIRVWDPLPKEQALLRSPGGAASSSSGSTLRKSMNVHPRSSPPTPSPSTQTSTTSVQVEFPPPTTAILPGSSQVTPILGSHPPLPSPSSLPPPTASNSSPASSTTNPHFSTGTTTNLRPRTDSLAYSEGDPTEDDPKDDSIGTNSRFDNRSTGTDNAGGQINHSRSNSVATFPTGTGDVLTASVPATPMPPTPPTTAKMEVQASPPTTTTPTPTSLPPVFPRARAHTADHVVNNPGGLPSSLGSGGAAVGGTAAPITSGGKSGSTMGSTILPSHTKPPMIHRRVVSTTTATTGATQQSPKLFRHARQISDMTMDTHQLDIIEMNLHHNDSHDDEATSDHAGGTGGDVWSKVSTTHKLRLSFVLLVTDKTLTSLKGNTRTQISMLRQVADLYSLSSYDTVTVHKIDPHDEEEVLKAVSADFVVVTIKDQFISRGDMHLFQQKLHGSWIYEGERLTESTRQIKAHAREIRHGNFAAKSGIITEKTMITFRSRSARIIWLVQLSSEMWDYSSPYERHHKNKDYSSGTTESHGGNNSNSICEIYFDQWIRFLYKLFEKWKTLEVTHSLTVIFFSRTLLAPGQKSALNCCDVYGRTYEDHYKPVIENETRTDWESLVVRIKEEFVKYPLEVGWNLKDRRPSSASQGNVLEAINVTLNIMQYHFLDRDLHRTGNSIVVVSPGCGVFEVDKGLAGITYQRMMDNGIGSDMLSLGLPPLHIAPFFLYNNEFRTVETRGVDTSETYYEVPHWMHLSFISYDREEHQLGDHIRADTDDSPILKQEGLDSFEIGPNGFLRHKGMSEAMGDQQNSLFKTKSSFSASGNKAATPGKARSQQERQLISGRDFRDILEACRPRVAGKRLPSALSAILKLNTYAGGANNAESREATISETKQQQKAWKQGMHLPLREWGSVDFSEFPVRSKGRSFRMDETILSRSQSNPLGDRGDDSESGSNSSFASYMSSAFGMSYDRVLWDHYESPLTSKAALQIQRSPSIEFDIFNSAEPADPDSTLGGDYMSVGTDNVSKSSSGQVSTGAGDIEWNQCDNETTMSGNSKQEKHMDNLRKLMDAHDSQVWAPTKITVSGKDEIQVIRPESLKHVDSEVTIYSTKRSQGKAGGLGAALSQYSSTLPKEGLPNVRLTRRASEILPGPNRKAINKERTRAQSPIFPTISQFQERGSRAMPPMLIPPLMSSSAVDLNFNTKYEHEATSVLHRPLTIENSPSISRENFGQIGVLSGSNYEYGNSTLQFTSGESARQLVRPIARSPPNSSFGLTGRSPTGSRGYDQGPISSSPPTISIQRDRASQKPSVKDGRGHSPPSTGIFKQRSGRPISPTRPGSRSRKASSGQGHGPTSKQSLRRRKVCNPFRQSDEDEVLAKRSHNRRRWSHVFPVGEVEFKRHSGPIWNSLTAPAILPLSVDYFPSPQELRDESTFQFNPYTVTLGGIENKHYSTHAELMLEMVRQRVTQDFQIVTSIAIKESERRPDPQRKGRTKPKARTGMSRRETFVPSLPTIKHDATGSIKHYLSMGHRIQVLSYDPSSDTIEIVHYNRKSAHNDPMNVYTYRFMMYSKIAQGYANSVQTFKKYSEPYKWNKVDNLICGEEDRQLEDGMRFRRVMFGLIPDNYASIEAEEEYISKFRRLLEYLGKLREKEFADDPLKVKVLSSRDTKGPEGDIFKHRRATEDSMTKFTISLKRGKKDPFEWMEISIDSTFDISQTYRIMFNWLVASSAKVDNQVQLLHRRCTQFGLRLISFPQTTISGDLFLHAFAVPTFISLRDKLKADSIDDGLKKLDFVDDGIRFTDGQVLECVERSKEFDFPRYRNGKIKRIPSKQYVHRSGALFIRNVRDRQGWSILVGIENYRHANKENGFREIALDKLGRVADLVDSLTHQSP